jgi:hypothetical protein
MVNPAYALGHSDQELERLSAQERLIGPATRLFFREGGIGTGMRLRQQNKVNHEASPIRE